MKPSQPSSPDTSGGINPFETGGTRSNLARAGFEDFDGGPVGVCVNTDKLCAASPREFIGRR